MPLVTSGEISIGGSTTTRSINLELGRAATATSSLDETALRTLAGKSSGIISLSDFYGKSAGAGYSFTIGTLPADGYNMWDVYDSANGRFVYGSANAVNTTTDGITWTAGTYQTTSNQSLHLRRHSNGTWISGHIAGYILTSPNGTSSWNYGTKISNTGYTYDTWWSGSQYVYAHTGGIWTSTTAASGYTKRLTSGEPWAGIARNPSTGRLLTVMSVGYQPAYLQTYTSDDNGTTWTLRHTITGFNSGTVNQLGAVFWFPAGNCFVHACGHFYPDVITGTIYKYSSDGLSYTTPFTQTGFYLWGGGVDSTNNRAIVTGSSGRVYVSTDATTWTAMTTGTTAMLKSTTWMPNINRLIILGYQNTTYLRGLAT